VIEIPDADLQKAKIKTVTLTFEDETDEPYSPTAISYSVTCNTAAEIILSIHKATTTAKNE
jgi:hypothetical protein